ncbi:Fungal specific transcription factor domain family protein [Aspergillus niger]|uniref:Fungal specific transcription factor domain family protein n=1 Tax=Aspergillus niger TaxID=5061 RepID=A0A505ICL5_ASPNG|nr:Fungal specific transcription factor domain family protein [Aspergillus niger]
MSDLPLPVKIDSKRQWRTLAKNNVEGVNIYNLEDYDSGSKISDPQYLSLRALWKFRPINEFKPCEWGILGVEEARASLMKLEHWADFLQAIPLEVSVEEILPIKHSLGKFELIYPEGQGSQFPETPSTDLDPDTPVDDQNGDLSYKEQRRFPRVSEENLVDLYLLALASVVTLSVEGVNAHWSPERKGFKVCDEKGEKLYEARIDGYLFLSNSRETK